MLAKDYKPKWTCWKHKTVKKRVKDHKRYCRRKFKQFLKSGNIRDLDASRKLLTRFDFD